MAGIYALLILATVTAGNAGERAPAPVILVTIDGVRYQEVFRGLDPGLSAGATGAGDLLPRMRARAAAEGFLTGDADRGDAFDVRNLGVCSLPAYLGILSGDDGGCWDNHCGRTRVETVLERARRELGLEAREVAAFASWPPIALAVERRPGNVTVNVGFEPFQAPWAPPDEETDALGRAQREDLPPWSHRRDRYTWALAMRYLERFRPRVLYVGLGDPDEWGHLGNYPAYVEAVRGLDDRLEELFRRLASMGDYGKRASVIVTTDHGRGTGARWRSHGPWYWGASHAWLFASTPATRAAPGRAGGGRYDHLSIRPTIEALLGLAPCPRCNEPIAELLWPQRADRGGAVSLQTGAGDCGG